MIPQSADFVQKIFSITNLDNIFTSRAGKNAPLSKRLFEVLKLATEIERKFLVDAQKISAVNFSSAEEISQGYLSTSPTVRVRLKNNRGYLTIKSSTVGITRQEFEYEIPAQDAAELLELCGERVLKKIRRKVSYAGKIWEVDFFAGRHAGLILAEVELSSADETVELPAWIDKEVSNDERYFNSNLV